MDRFPYYAVTSGHQVKVDASKMAERYPYRSQHRPAQGASSGRRPYRVILGRLTYERSQTHPPDTTSTTQTHRTTTSPTLSPTPHLVHIRPTTPNDTYTTYLTPTATHPPHTTPSHSTQRTTLHATYPPYTTVLSQTTTSVPPLPTLPQIFQ